MEHEPAPSPPTRPSLASELRAATREQHHTLNTLIVSRLPLCLSPQVDSPLVYAIGMVTFGQIYFAFEEFLVTRLGDGRLDPRIEEVYNTLHLPQLIRTGRLREDIELIKSRLGEPAVKEISAFENESKVFHSRIQGLLSTKPHALMGYAWAMYLALFNGGRWIQSQLISQGPDFWRGEPVPLSFWEFEDNGSSDSQGEHLKVLFQERFSAASTLLRDDESDDIVKETGRLFELCSEIVHGLDDKLATTTSTAASTTSPKSIESDGQSLARLTTPFITAWQYLASSYASLRPNAK